MQITEINLKIEILEKNLYYIKFKGEEQISIIENKLKCLHDKDQEQYDTLHHLSKVTKKAESSLDIAR